MIRYLLAGLASVLAVPVGAQTLLALPDDEGMSFWDTQPDQPVAIYTGVAGGRPGACYSAAEAGRLVRQIEDTSCLNYLVVEGPIQTGGAPSYAITGQVEPLSRDLSPTFRGFVITGVDGIANCGERADCDRIYIAGVSSEAVLGDLLRAMQGGVDVQVSGAGVWNLESIDIVIDAITPAN